MDRVFGSEEARGKLFAALARARAKMGKPAESGRNAHRGYSYSTAEDLERVALPALSAEGVAVIQTPAASERGQVAIATIIGHEGGAYIASTASLTVDAMKGNSAGQNEGTAYTYLRRYALSGSLVLGAAGEDLDATAPDKDMDPLATLRSAVERAKSKKDLWRSAQDWKAANAQKVGPASGRQQVKDLINAKAVELGGEADALWASIDAMEKK